MRRGSYQMVRAFLVHGWGGGPKTDWLPWMAKQLRELGHKVSVPKMPNTNKPVMHKWIAALALTVGTPDKETILVGHSIGCQTILRYVSILPEGQKIGKIVLVAPWIKLKSCEDEEKSVAEPWEETPINWKGIRTHCKDITCFFSTNDQYVSVGEAKIFEKNLGAKIIIEKNKGHFSRGEGIVEVPSVLKAILEK